MLFDFLTSNSHRPMAPSGGSGWGALGLAFAGLAVVLGSLYMWGDPCASTCNEITLQLGFCRGRSGLDMGAGVLTAVIGVLLAATGVTAARRGGVSPFRTEAIGLGLVTVLIAAAYIVVASSTRDYVVGMPTLGLYLVVVAGALSAASALRLRSPDSSTRRWALDRLPALALLSLGVAIWLLVFMRHFPVRAEALPLAMVPMALGLGYWSDRSRSLPIRRRLAGTALIVYSAVALVASLAADHLLWLLEFAPLALLIPLAIGPIRRQLPPLDPPLLPEKGRRWREAALVAMGSKRFLLSSALALTALTVGLLIVRLAASKPPESTAICDILLSAAPGLLVLVGLGIVMSVGIALALTKRM